jgi:hypothetical protein
MIQKKSIVFMQLVTKDTITNFIGSLVYETKF